MSNELKATPGPWKVANYEDSVCDDALIVDSEGEEVLGISEWARVEDADLDMMAASREMYDALEYVRELCIDMDLNNYFNAKGDIDGWEEPDMTAVDAVLAKARGEK